MVSIRKMQKEDVETLYNIALRSFQPDYEKYGVYPPLINLKSKKFLPPIIFGKSILKDDNTIVGGAFVTGLGKKGEIGAIFALSKEFIIAIRDGVQIGRDEFVDKEHETDELADWLAEYIRQKGLRHSLFLFQTSLPIYCKLQ